MNIYNDVVTTLLHLGCITTPDASAPDPEIICSINNAAEKIRSNINSKEIPDGLHYTWVNMAVGLFLFDKKNTGQLGEVFDFNMPAKKITEGDVSVEFTGISDGSLTPEARFDKLVNSLINPPAYLFARFRRFVW